MRARMRDACARRWIVRALAACAAGGPCLASAHHAPGHGVPDSARSSDILGPRAARASTRVALSTDATFIDRGLAPGWIHRTAVLGEVAPIPALSVGAALPFDLIAERAQPVRAGLGDTQLFVRVTPYAGRLEHRFVTLSLFSTVPTRTVRTSADPGPNLTLSPSVAYSRVLSWGTFQIAGGFVHEHRMTGDSFDAALSGAVLARAGRRVFVGPSLSVQTRFSTICIDAQGARTWCEEGRAGEIDRALGSTRGVLALPVVVQTSPRTSVAAVVAGPITPTRDLAVNFGVSFQATWGALSRKRSSRSERAHSPHQ